MSNDKEGRSPEVIISQAETFRALTRIEAKQDSLLENQKALIEDHHDYGKRLTKVEARQNRWIGGMAAIAAAAGFLSPYVQKLFGGDG